MKRQEIVDYAKTWIGTKWRHQGRSAVGLDCVGLLIKIAEHFEVPHEDKLNYARSPTGFEFLDQVRKYLPVAPVSDNRHGYVAMFRENKFPCHTGVISVEPDGHEYVIHATAVSGFTQIDLLKNSGLILIECRIFPGMED